MITYAILYMVPKLYSRALFTYRDTTHNTIIMVMPARGVSIYGTVQVRIAIRRMLVAHTGFFFRTIR
ncbi:hypothetical protein D3C71_1951550 [compost metagenome]